MTKLKLFVFDFDGTALGGHKPYARFPRPFVRFLDGLSRRGILWATNTGWPLEAQEHLLHRSRLRSRPAMLIGQSGMRIGWLRSGRLVQDRRHQKQADETGRRFKKRVWPAVRKAFIKLLKDDLVEQIAFDDFFASFSIINFACRPSCEAGAWRAVKPLLDSGHYYSLNPDRGSRGMLFPAHLNKGDTLRNVQRRLRVSPEATIVAGDEMNDRHMFDPAIAKWMVCPSNAHPFIKAIVRQADGIVARKRYSKGVMEATQRLLNDCSPLSTKRGRRASR